MILKWKDRQHINISTFTWYPPICVAVLSSTTLSSLNPIIYKEPIKPSIPFSLRLLHSNQSSSCVLKETRKYPTSLAFDLFTRVVINYRKVLVDLTKKKNCLHWWFSMKVIIVIQSLKNCSPPLPLSQWPNKILFWWSFYQLVRILTDGSITQKNKK